MATATVLTDFVSDVNLNPDSAGMIGEFLFRMVVGSLEDQVSNKKNQEFLRNADTDREIGLVVSLPPVVREFIESHLGRYLTSNVVTPVWQDSVSHHWPDGCVPMIGFADTDEPDVVVSVGYKEDLDRKFTVDAEEPHA